MDYHNALYVVFILHMLMYVFYTINRHSYKFIEIEKNVILSKVFVWTLVYIFFLEKKMFSFQYEYTDLLVKYCIDRYAGKLFYQTMIFFFFCLS